MLTLMNFKQLIIGSIMIPTLGLMLPQKADGQSLVPLDFSAFRDPGESWEIVGDVTCYS